MVMYLSVHFEMIEHFAKRKVIYGAAADRGENRYTYVQSRCPLSLVPSSAYVNFMLVHAQ